MGLLFPPLLAQCRLIVPNIGSLQTVEGQSSVLLREVLIVAMGPMSRNLVCVGGLSDLPGRVYLQLRCEFLLRSG